MTPQHSLFSRSALALPLLLLCALPAQAQSDERVFKAGESSWAVGAGLGMYKKPYIGSRTRVMALPLVSYENSWVRLAGPMIDFKLAQPGDFSFTLRARLALQEGYKSSDAGILDGMEKRKGGVWIGPAMSWRTGYGNLTASLAGDASGNSKGAQAQIGFSRSFLVGEVQLTPHIGATWLSDKYVDYYYGVKSNEALALRPQYSGKATTNLDLGLRTSYKVASNQSVSVDIGVRRYGSGIIDSPLVDRRITPQASAVYLYRF